MEDLTLEQWQEHCSKNCGDHYGMAVDLVIITLWIENAFAKETVDDVLRNTVHGLSGAQAEMAKHFASKYRPTWLIKE